MKKLLLPFITVLSLLFVSPAFAQNGIKNRTFSVDEQKANAQAKKDEVKNNVEERRNDLMENKASREAELKVRKEELLSSRLVMRDRFSSRSAELKERIKEHREEMLKLRGERRELLKEKLKAFKDQRKASIAARVDENLDKVNQHRTDAMARHLEQMSKLLGKIETRIASASAAGKNTASASAALAVAEGKIASASGLVQAQAAKDYTVSVSSESALKSDVQATRDRLHTDLKTVHAAVVEARKSIADVLKAFAGLGGNNE